MTQHTQQELARKVEADIASHVPGPVVSYGENQVLIRLFNGQKMFLDLRDFAITPHIVLEGVWEPHITIPWLALASESGVVLDIGANMGYFGLLAANHLSTAGKVVMFEANPDLAEVAARNLSVNWKNVNAKIENLAIASITGNLELNILKDYWGCSSIVSGDKLKDYLSDEMDVVVEKSINVESISVDVYCDRADIGSVDLIKLDIEGYEEVAYLGMKKTIDQSPDLTMFIEFTRDAYDNPGGFFDKICSDFDHTYIVGADGKLIDASQDSYESIFGAADSPTWQMVVASKNNLAHLAE